MLQTRNLRLAVAGRPLIHGLNWQVRAGECWCVIGPNGAGKSTLLRTLAGLREPDGGVIEWQGRSMRDWPLSELARARAYLPQARYDAFGYTVLEAVLGARHPHAAASQWESEDDHRTALSALADLQIDQFASRDVRTLSGGERQRVAIAAALAQETPLLLLDEPASALDLAHQVGIMHLFASLCRSAGRLIILVSHDLNLAAGVASHVLLLMDDGRWHAGTAGEVMNAPLLGDCLGYPVEAIRHGSRTVFLPMTMP